MQLDNIRAMLDQVYHGRTVSEATWSAAKEELRVAELTEQPRQQSIAVTTSDEAVLVAGRLFLALESVIVALRNSGHINAVNTEIVDTMIDAKAMLRRLGYEPVAKRRSDPLVFNRAR
jgi:hypothetical protein